MIGQTKHVCRRGIGMSMNLGNSRKRYLDYRRKLAKQRESGSKNSAAAEKSPKVRTFGRLLWAFLGLLRGHGWAVGFAMGTLTISTILHLAPPLATKLLIDSVL